MRAFMGPVVVFLVGLVAWLVIAPKIDENVVNTLLTWGGIIAVIAALVWAVLIATGRGSGRRL